MKKIVFAALALISLCGSSKAAQPTISAQPVKVIVPTQTTCSSMTITTTPTEVTGNTTVISTTYGAFAVKVTNMDSSKNVCCSHSASVSCSGNLIGDVIAPTGAPPYYWSSWGISSMEPWYCVSSGANTSINVCLAK